MNKGLIGRKVEVRNRSKTEPFLAEIVSEATLIQSEDSAIEGWYVLVLYDGILDSIDTYYLTVLEEE